MKSLASITDNDIETIKMALNDSLSDMTSELKQELSPEQKNTLTNYKDKYSRVFEKLKTSGSMYALTETELDIVAGGLNDAIELIEDNLTDDLSEEEHEEILGYRNDCQRLVGLLAS
jgi:rRNA maturation endonuclease Nob1